MAISDSEINANATGVNLSNGTNASIDGSTVTNNTTGVLAFNATLGVSNCNISHNGTGVNASTGGTIRLTGSIITNNGTGLTAAGTIVSYTSNMRNGNGVDGSPTSTISLQ